MKTILICLSALVVVWFADTISGELQEVYECKAREGLWIKDHCIEKSTR